MNFYGIIQHQSVGQLIDGTRSALSIIVSLTYMITFEIIFKRVSVVANSLQQNRIDIVFMELGK